jgi:hypothetical protein
MILGDPTPAAGQTEGHSRITVDALFRGAAARRPDAVALVDPQNRESFTDGAPRRLTYAEADRVVSAIAGRLRGMGLSTDSIVGIQLPHTVEGILTLLGVLRAGLIAAPLPLLWRRAEAAVALARVGAKALITCRRVDHFEHCQFATRVAAEVFSIRYVCGFGPALPDGAVALDDLFTVEQIEPVPPLDRDNKAAHLAIITFEVGEDGPVPVARRHIELLAGGLGIVLESRLEPDASMLSTLAPASFAGICLTLLPWLLTGGTLVLHQPFDADIFARQRQDHGCGVLLLPAQVAFRLAAAGSFAQAAPATILAAWRNPERLAESPDWESRDTALIDVPVFGEAGFVAARRGADGRPRPLPLGRVTAPRHGDGAVTLVELGTTETATLSLRGPIVPAHVFPPGIERIDQPHFKIAPDGSVDTGYACQVDVAASTIAVTAPPSGIVCVGGYRFPLGGLKEKVGRVETDATLGAKPDPLLGQCLIGTAPDSAAMIAALDGFGLNPLVARAFAGQDETPAGEVRAVA